MGCFHGTARASVSWIMVALACLATTPGRADAEPIGLSTTPVQLVFDDPAAERVGHLVYLGGLALKSSDANFGGLSGLVVEADSLTAVTDRGFWFRARVVLGTDLRLVDVTDARLAPILSSRGQPLRIARGEHDAEAVEVWNDSLLVSFERFHRIAVYDRAPGDAARPVYLEDVPRLAKQPANGGIESLANLGDGRIVALSEELDGGEDRIAGWLIDGARRDPLGYPQSRWKPTDAAYHPRIGLLVLERRFSGLGGFSARLRRVDPATIAPGAMLDGPIVARFEAPTVTDNFEGLSISEGLNGQLTIWLVSDDNFSFLQRTLLLVFRWGPV